MGGLYTIVDLDDGKWFVASEKSVENEKYSYLIKVNDEANDFIDEYKVVRSFYLDNEEYMETITDKELLSEIMPVLVPESTYFIDEIRTMLS